MKDASWPKVFAFVGISVMSLAVALFSTSVATAGVAAGVLGRASEGSDLLSAASALLLAAVAAAAVFAYLAIVNARALVRRRD
ncbi:MAG: hypothetical protein ACRDF0_02010 [Candidatus Limnocylindria bacterium]